MSSIPDKPTLDGLEAKWRERWTAEGTFAFDRSKTRDEVYSIDTPPPTVSGSLHIGHVMSFTHTDTVARYQRMRGKEVFYPMGWDDNGLNVERRVQMLTATLCDPSLPYDPDFTPPQPDAKGKLPKDPVRVSRPNFVELCESVVEEMEAEYKELWSTVGLSVDWDQTYTTMGPVATRISQRGFLRLLDQGVAYRSGAPTLWDVDMKTAVAQAELEDREVPGAYHKLAFTHVDENGETGAPIWIETTRPELLPACVAMVAHPDDERYQPLFGTTAITPLFGVEVPIVAHELAQPDKGTGVAMICTFGDTTDVIWWRELDLPIRPIVRHDGRLERDLTWEAFGDHPWVSTDPDEANANYAELGGKTIFTAQKNIVELLMAKGKMEGEPRPITHPVKFWENGKKALEIVTSNQWFIRYPPASDLIERIKGLEFHPEYMRVRFEDWANGIQGDWNITRQRFFGVPFPIWYPIDEHGDVDHLSPIPATEDMLPVDPTTVTAPGFSEDQRNQPGGFAADPDVMDTWNTSSMTPQIAGRWEEDPDLYERVYPMDLRPQAHDIIRTWLFATVVKSHELFDELPFSHATISGFVNDPDRKKLSKSKDNASDGPFDLLEEFGADAIRYWSCGAGPGRDLNIDKGQMKIGRRLGIKILNASKFALLQGEPAAGATVTEPLDKAMLLALADLVDECTGVFDAYDYARALERAETFFWNFTDDYLELVKGRAYGTGGDADPRADSAKVALRHALETLLKLFAPFLPYATEEVWSWWQDGSIHRAAWPTSDELRTLAGGADDEAERTMTVAGEVLTLLRKAKSDAKVSMRTEITTATIVDTPERLAAFERARTDVLDAGKVQSVQTSEGTELSVDVTLADA